MEEWVQYVLLLGILALVYELGYIQIQLGRIDNAAHVIAQRLENKELRGLEEEYGDD